MKRLLPLKMPIHMEMLVSEREIQKMGDGGWTETEDLISPNDFTLKPASTPLMVVWLNGSQNVSLPA